MAEGIVVKEMKRTYANRLALNSDDLIFRAFTRDKGYILEDSGKRPTHPERYRINNSSPYVNPLWTKLDAYYKWSACLLMFEEVRWVDKSMKVVDLGAGEGPICHIIADMGYDVVGVDIKPWNYPYQSLVRMVIKDGVEFLEEYEDESVDIFIDGCAVTHFDTRHNASTPNLGWKSVLENVARVMKPNGYFIVTSDILLDGDEYKGEFISPEQILQLAEESGLICTTEFDNTREGAMNRLEPAGNMGVANFMFVKK